MRRSPDVVPMAEGLSSSSALCQTCNMGMPLPLHNEDLFNHLRNHQQAMVYNIQVKWNFKVEKIYDAYKEDHSESDHEGK